jgi:hypothetical protein
VQENDRVPTTNGDVAVTDAYATTGMIVSAEILSGMVITPEIKRRRETAASNCSDSQDQRASANQVRRAPGNGDSGFHWVTVETISLGEEAATRRSISSRTSGGVGWRGEFNP